LNFDETMEKKVCTVTCEDISAVDESAPAEWLTAGWRGEARLPRCRTGFSCTVLASRADDPSGRGNHTPALTGPARQDQRDRLKCFLSQVFCS